MHYLYRITNQLNNKTYIGQSNDGKYRWRQHKYFAKNPEKTGQYIHRAMSKYGVENFTFEIIAICQNQDDANAIEIELITQYDSRNSEKGYNIKPGGHIWDEKTKVLISEKIKQHYQNYPEDRLRAANQTKIRWLNLDFRNKMILLALGRPNIMNGKFYDKEHGEKISAALKGKSKTPHPQEILEKISATRKSFSKEKKEDISRRITASRGQTVLTLDQKMFIVNDERPSRVIAEEYKVNASTVQRIKKSHGCSLPVGRRPSKR